MNFSRITILFSGFLLAACTNHEPKPSKTQEFFSTLIKSDGTKQFSYAMVMEMPTGEKHGGPGGRHGGHGGPSGGHSGHHGGEGGDHGGGSRDDSPDDHLSYMFSEGLLAKLSDTGFCRQGYKQLDKNGRMGAMQINAECNDVATSEDRNKFPNPPPKKVKEENIE